MKIQGDSQKLLELAAPFGIPALEELLGGIQISDEIRETMETAADTEAYMHGFTYSGHAMACAVGLKNLEIMERERLWERAAAMGTRLHKGLQQALGDPRGCHDRVGDDQAAELDRVGDVEVARLAEGPGHCQDHPVGDGRSDERAELALRAQELRSRAAAPTRR